MKKILSVLLAVCLLAGMLPLSASAAEPFTYENSNVIITNVTDRGTLDEDYSFGRPFLSCTCLAPTTITPGRLFQENMEKVDWDIAIIPEDLPEDGSPDEDFDWDTYAGYEGESLTLTEPGDYLVGFSEASITGPVKLSIHVEAGPAEDAGTRIADASCWGMYNYMYIDVAILPWEDATPYWYQLTEKGGTEVLAEGMLNHKDDDPDAPAGARFAEMNWDSPEKAPKAGGAGYTISIFAVKDGAPQGEAISSGDFVIDGDIAKMDVYEGYPDDPFQQEVSKHITATVDNQKRVVRLQGEIENEEDFLSLSLLGFDKEDNFLCGDRIRLEKNEDGTYTLAPLPEPNEDGGYDYLDFVNTWVANPDGTERKYTIDVSGVTSHTTEFVDYEFDDVDPESWCYYPVIWALENGITTGTGAGTFSPDGACTREQIVTFLWRAAGKPEPTATANPFTDVSESSYAYKAVLWAVENNITAGTSSTTFSPKKNCTRDQAVTFLWRANGKPEPTAASSFTDVKPGSFYEKAVGWAVENGITTGAGAGIFNPGGVCTRGHIVTFLYRDKK